MDRAELDEKYARSPPEAVEEEWRAQHAASLTSCIHGHACANRGTCQVGPGAGWSTMHRVSYVSVGHQSTRPILLVHFVNDAAMQCLGVIFVFVPGASELCVGLT